MPEIPDSTTRSVIKRNLQKEDIQHGEYYALIIGISEYKNYQSLEHPVKDARKFERILVNQYTFSKKKRRDLVTNQVVAVCEETSRFGTQSRSSSGRNICHGIPKRRRERKRRKWSCHLAIGFSSATC